ncbi:Gfo/Idh/MocA family oxidoreductase [Winogradskyella luteola]|uniref:Gfo/Idh/MocA family oxidoreductase n=1 Tax=Winogradskyella luteola TaxID=2828330 RepID=A0A9X1JPZ9_9FLAO|nr:Gfo/Idh/MocA family oxidoreductase [Winogradskyella luteola]MBV7269244.1 Gfo/Idh/MocA family oxidoreductase [Winogradskyella luteola]
MKILIYGLGRMGLTHYVILNNLVPNAEFTFVEPNKILNFLSKRNINGRFLTNDRKLSDPFDITLITTPPFVHESLVDKCLERGDKIVFVEKPFGGHSNYSYSNQANNVFIGYVLRFNPIIHWVKNNINPTDILECQSQYLSNTIENKPKGWRNGVFSGVLNEMGSHILDLNNYLFEIEDYDVNYKEMKSHISDVDDEVKFNLTSKDRKFNFYFNWVDKTIRKPMFNFELALKNGSSVYFDQQKIEIRKDGEIEKISVVALEQKIPFYLRGVDFTKQMEDLINNQNTLCTIQDALVINNLMKQILE